MTSPTGRPPSTSGTIAVLIVGPEPLRHVVADELRDGVADLAVVRELTTTSADRDAADLDRELHDELAGAVVGLLVLCTGDTVVDDEVAVLTGALRGNVDPPVVVVTDRASHADLHRSIDAELLTAVVPVPWVVGGLTFLVRTQLVRWLAHRDAAAAGVALPTAGASSMHAPRGSLLDDLELDEHAVARKLVDAIDRALGRRPRVVLPSGTRLTRQDRPVGGLLVVLRGSVALDRSTDLGELRLHHASTGPIVGLLSLVQQHRAFFTARTTTEVEAVHLSVEQLDLALGREAAVSAALAAALVKALARRLRRAEQLQLEKRELARQLELEHAQLRTTLHELEATRLELVESARLATLGELAAGVAHELNNPVAALVRAASHLAEDLRTLVRGHPDGPLLERALQRSHDRPPRSTAEDRRSRRVLRDAIGDADLARRLVEAGITDPDDARAIVAATDREGFAQLAAAAGVGASLRNLEVSGTHVAELVTSLRAYARPTTEPTDVDVAASLEDTLRMVMHLLEGIEVERAWMPVPSIRAHPGQLGQVWANLVSNAAESMSGHGKLRLATDQPDADHVRVSVTDDGPGIAPEVAARMFEPRFTTKSGTVRYGLGLGLAIAKRIVDDHGGTLQVDSTPGATTISVVLPISGPPTRLGVT